MQNDTEDTTVPQGQEEGATQVEPTSEPTAPTTPEATDTPSESNDSEITPESIQKIQEENQRLRAYQSKQERAKARMQKRGGNQIPPLDTRGMSDEDLRTWANNPMTQDLLHKTAISELREGVRDILSDYPDVPKALKDAVLKNPQGFVQPGTLHVEDALLDIEDYLDDYVGSDGNKAKAPETTAKEFPVAGTNSQTSSSGDVIVDDLVALFAKGTDGMNEAFRRLTDKEVDQKTFDRAMREAENKGILQKN